MMFGKARSMIAGAFLTVLLAGSANAADVARGKQLFVRCAICHATDATTLKLGPPLGNIVNRKAAAISGFNYSPAMKASKITWKADTLDKYLAAPRTFIPGNKMVFAGLSAPADRADLVEYLSSISQAPPAKRK